MRRWKLAWDRIDPVIRAMRAERKTHAEICAATGVSDTSLRSRLQTLRLVNRNISRGQRKRFWGRP